MRGVEKLVSIRDKAAMFQRDAEVMACSSVMTVWEAIGFQKLPDHFVERDGFRAGQINHAVQRFRHRDAGQRCLRNNSILRRFDLFGIGVFGSLGVFPLSFCSTPGGDGLSVE